MGGVSADDSSGSACESYIYASWGFFFELLLGIVHLECSHGRLTPSHLWHAKAAVRSTCFVLTVDKLLKPVFNFLYGAQIMLLKLAVRMKCIYSRFCIFVASS